MTLSNANFVEFSISTGTCSQAAAKERETVQRCTLALGGDRGVRSMSQNRKIQHQRIGRQGGGGGGEIMDMVWDKYVRLAEMVRLRRMS